MFYSGYMMRFSWYSGRAWTIGGGKGKEATVRTLPLHLAFVLHFRMYKTHNKGKETESTEKKRSNKPSQYGASVHEVRCAAVLNMRTGTNKTLVVFRMSDELTNAINQISGTKQ